MAGAGKLPWRFLVFLSSGAAVEEGALGYNELFIIDKGREASEKIPEWTWRSLEVWVGLLASPETGKTR